MKLNLTPEMIASIQYMTLPDAQNYAMQILHDHSEHKNAVKKNDGQKFVRLEYNIKSKKSSIAIMKMFYDMYLSGDGLGVVGSKWKRHYTRYA